MSEFMKMASPPTGIFAFKSYIGLDALEYLKKHYRSKLEEIDFAGFGNLPLFQYLDHKPLASIEENSYQMGFEAAQLIFRKINTPEKEVSSHITVPCRLVIHQ